MLPVNQTVAIETSLTQTCLSEAGVNLKTDNMYDGPLPIKSVATYYHNR
jgi:hypothetical protein